MMYESTRRKVNLEFDQEPSFHHKFNLKFALPYIKNKKVLDIGCWTGQFEKIAVKHTKEIWGIDPGIEAIKVAKKLVPSAKFKVGNALKLEFKEKSFDTVTILDVIEHIPKNTEGKCLKEIRRVLKTNGYLIISTPLAHLLSILLDPAFFIIGHRHYSEEKLTSLVSNAGFKTIIIQKRGGVLRMAVAIIQSIFKHIFRKKFVNPKWINNIIGIEDSHAKIAEIYLVAKLVNK